MKDDSASYYDSQEFQDILKMYESMLEEGSSIYFDSMDIANIAEFYSISGDFDKSDAAVEFGLRLHPQDPDILIAKANGLLQNGQTAQARVLLESIDDPDNQELMYVKGTLELAEGNIENADSCFQNATDLSQDDSGMINDIIVKYMNTRQFELCQKWLDKALVLEPDSRNFIELQADLFFDTGQMDAAIVWYDNLLDEFPYDTYYWEQLGRIYYEKNEFPKARECFEFIEAIEPANKSARMMSASCIFSMEEWAQAYAIYRSLLDEDSTSYTLLYYCGRCKFEMEQYGQALPYFQQSFESLTQEEDEVPTEMFVELYTYLAESAIRTGDTDSAASYIADGLALAPSDVKLTELHALLSKNIQTDNPIQQ